MEAQKSIKEATENLFSKMLALDPKTLIISEYSKTYLLNYFNNYSYYMSLYSQLFYKAFKKSKKTAAESIFVDYGGGCGMLSLLAKELGFKTVIYNDINKYTLTDAQKISEKLDIKIDYYISGDAEEFVREINIHNLKPDLICSFDVLEHIYDIESWINTVAAINHGFTLIFMTGANPKNPFIAHRLKKLHLKSEYETVKNNIRNENIYMNSSFLEERKKIIANKFPDLKVNEVSFLATRSRGLRIDDIERMVAEYISTGDISYRTDHSTNTCDPYSGSWTEKLINLRQLKSSIKNINLKVEISNSLYGYSNKKGLNLIKFLLNQLIKLSGQGSLLLSPSFTLEIQKQ